MLSLMSGDCWSALERVTQQLAKLVKGLASMTLTVLFLAGHLCSASLKVRVEKNRVIAETAPASTLGKDSAAPSSFRDKRSH
jgi:hypothetical protein